MPASNPSQPPPLIQRQSTFKAYSQILDDFPDNGPQRQWSIRQANSRLHPHQLQSALESDLSLHAEKQSAIPMTVLSLNNDPSSPRRPSNNPYLIPDNTLHGDSTTMDRTRSVSHKTYGFNDPFAVAPMEAWQEMKDYNLRANGLPTLDQTMRLHTLSPITQSNFMAFLRRRGAHQNLNFLVELETHDKLWRAYLQSNRRHTQSQLDSNADVSRFLEAATANTTPSHTPTVPTMAGGYSETPDTEDLLQSSPVHNHFEASDTYASRIPQGSNGSALSRHDLAQNATRIYRTFCSPADAAQPVHLPEDHRLALQTLIETHHRPEPVVFESARSHVFDTLNVFYYPQFVDAMLHTNMVRTSARIALVLGMLILTVGFSVELSLVFLDEGTRATRWWGLAPFFFGWSFLLTGFVDFAWWLALMGKSETNFMVFSAIQDKTVLSLHRKRAMQWLAASLVLAVISTIIFAFVPAHRLRSPH